MKEKNRRLARCAMLAALALIFSYVEVLIPFSVGLPGVKLGLANIVVVFAIYMLGARYALYLNLARIILAGLLFGSPFSTLYALCGGLLSLCAMLVLKKTNLFSVIGVSMAGGFFHNLGQLIAAAVIVKTPQVVSYLPVLVFSGIAAGIVNGIIATFCMEKLKHLKM